VVQLVLRFFVDTIFFQRNFALILKNIKEVKRHLELEPLEP
jgi:hypothetical protein